MSDGLRQPPTAYCGDADLAYERSRGRFDEDGGFAFDEAYRRAHLPLVAPSHPLAIHASPHSSYVSGKHDPVYSLALPVSAEELLSSPAFLELEEELRSATFARKISWSTFDARRDKLHATICSSLSSGEPPLIDARTREGLSRIGPLGVVLRGLFSGSLNVGRLYVRVYPERRTGGNVIHEIQRLCGRPTTDLYVVGLFNFVDEPSRTEGAAVKELLDRWWGRLFLQTSVDRLWLLRSRDDLVLDGCVDRIIPLVRTADPRIG